MQLDNWLLEIECDSLATQASRDPEYIFPRDEISRIIEKLMSMWGGLPEEFYEDAEWDDTSIKVTFPASNILVGFYDWLFMTCDPKSVKLTKVGD